MTGFSEPADIIDAFAAALNAKDAERLGDLFSEDAQFVNVRGVLMHGRHGIVQGHKVSFAGPLAGSVFQFDSVDQSLITPDVAVLQAHCLRDRLPTHLRAQARRLPLFFNLSPVGARTAGGPLPRRTYRYCPLVELPDSSNRPGRAPGSGRKLPLTLFGSADDVAVSAPRVTRHAPDVNCRTAASGPNANYRRVCASNVPPSVPEVAKNGDPADLDVDVFRHVDIDVPAGEQEGYGRARLIHHRIAEVEVQIAEDRRATGPPA
jgi:uncharacterized protein (TIGR02246 family)